MNLIQQTIRFMNEANYKNAISGKPSVWKGVTGMLVKTKREKERNLSKSRADMRKAVGAKHFKKKD